MRRFYLHRRGNIWYAELVDKAFGVKLSAKSTRQTIRDEAAIIVNGWLVNGIPSQGETPSKKVSDVLDLATILTIIKKSNLNSVDVSRIGTALTEKGLVSSVVLKPALWIELIKLPVCMDPESGSSRCRNYTDKEVSVRCYLNSVHSYSFADSIASSISVIGHRVQKNDVK